MDMQLLRYLFGACIEAARILGTDTEFAKELTEKRARLAPTQIGSDGRVMEWLEEYKEVDPQHRHISHLWGLYPGHEITPAARRIWPLLRARRSMCAAMAAQAGASHTRWLFGRGSAMATAPTNY